MSPENFEKLIDLQDGLLDEAEKAEVMRRLASDQELNQDWQQVQVAVGVIRHAGLAEQVAKAKTQFASQQQSKVVPIQQASVRRFSNNMMKVAAALVLVIGSFAAIKYMTATPQDLYGKYYVSYDLSTPRSAAKTTALEAAYARKEWRAVITESRKLVSHNNRSLFLTGMANMELKDYPAAIAAFKNILQVNDTAREKLFQDEAQYYLAMGYLAMGNTNDAKPLLEEIRNDGGHLYHGKIK